MKTLLFFLAIAAGLPAWAEPESGVPAERARIALERRQADARLAAEETACYQAFAVNDCLNAARAQRRERLSDLRRQELSLNDADRKRRAGDRVRSIEERNSAQKQEDSAAARAQAVVRQREKQEALDRRAAERAQDQATKVPRQAKSKSEPPTPKPAHRKAKEQREHDSAEALRRHQERQKEAQERRERVSKREAQARKTGVRPLPVPP